MGSINCPKCGTENEPGALECLMCGIVFAKYQESQQRMEQARLGTHEIDYKIIGDDMQVVEIELDPGETVIAEAGAMNYMDQGITFEAKMGDGSDAGEGFFGKLMGAGKRALTGESIFMTHFTNRFLIFLKSLNHKW